MRAIDGFPNYYIDRWGNVFSRSRYRALRPCDNGHGYKCVNLYYEKGKAKKMYVHRLVAKAYIPNPDNLPEVNHVNGNRKDNRVENLEWCTHSQNHQHAWDKLNRTAHAKGKFGKDNPSAKPVLQLNRDGSVVRKWGSAIDAARGLGIPKSSISCVCNERPNFKTAGGFVWRFA